MSKVNDKFNLKDWEWIAVHFQPSARESMAKVAWFICCKCTPEEISQRKIDPRIVIPLCGIVLLNEINIFKLKKFSKRLEKLELNQEHMNEIKHFINSAISSINPSKKWVSLFQTLDIDLQFTLLYRLIKYRHPTHNDWRNIFLNINIRRYNFLVQLYYFFCVLSTSISTSIIVLWPHDFTPPFPFPGQSQYYGSSFLDNLLDNYNREVRAKWIFFIALITLFIMLVLFAFLLSLFSQFFKIFLKIFPKNLWLMVFFFRTVLIVYRIGLIVLMVIFMDSIVKFFFILFMLMNKIMYILVYILVSTIVIAGFMNCFLHRITLLIIFILNLLSFYVLFRKFFSLEKNFLILGIVSVILSILFFYIRHIKSMSTNPLKDILKPNQ